MKKTLRDEFAMAALGPAVKLMQSVNKDALQQFADEHQLSTVEGMSAHLAYEIADEMLKHREKHMKARLQAYKATHQPTQDKGGE